MEDQGSEMTNNYKLLTRLLVGVLKHQAKRYLGEEVITALAEAGTEHFGERLLEILKEEASTREHAKRLSRSIKSAADELERTLAGGAYLRIEDAPAEIVRLPWSDPDLDGTGDWKLLWNERPLLRWKIPNFEGGIGKQN